MFQGSRRVAGWTLRPAPDFGFTSWWSKRRWGGIFAPTVDWAFCPRYVMSGERDPQPLWEMPLQHTHTHTHGIVIECSSSSSRVNPFCDTHQWVSNLSLLPLFHSHTHTRPFQHNVVRRNVSFSTACPLRCPWLANVINCLGCPARLGRKHIHVPTQMLQLDKFRSNSRFSPVGKMCAVPLVWKN